MLVRTTIAALMLVFSVSGLSAFAADTLNVAVPVFNPGIPSDYNKREKEGIYPEVRKAESRYLAVRLAETLTRSGEFGAVRVVPNQNDILSDVVVRVRITESNGGSFKATVVATDSRGKSLLKKKYKQTVHPRFYRDRTKSGVEPYQTVLTSITRDLAAKVGKIKPKTIQKIKNTTTLRYGMALAPEAFDGTLKVRTSSKSGTSWKIKSMPAENDPMLQRIAALRVRDDMFSDAMQVTYQNFSSNMHEDYFNWREESAVEYEAIRKAKKKARGRIFGGILAAAAGVVVAAETKGTYGDAAAIGLIGAGAASVASGVQKNKEAKQYRSIMQEHARSFDASIEPQVVEFEQETATLTGTIDQQFAQFRALLARVYESETVPA